MSGISQTDAPLDNGIEAIVTGAVRRPSMVVVSTLAAVVALALVARHLSLDALPDVTPNQVLVLTPAPGLTPEEVERLVTRPVELALGGAPGLDEHRSISRPGLSAVTAVFHDDVDPWLARQIVGERIASVTLPAGVEPPALGPLSGGLGEILQFTLRSKTQSPATLLDLVTVRVDPILRAVPGVVEVNTWGGAQRTLEVRADPRRLAQYALTLDDAQTALARATGTAPGAALRLGTRQVLLRAQALPTQPDALAEVVLLQRPGEQAIRVKDIGVVVEGARPRLGAATADGEGEVVYVMAQMLRGENALEVMDRIHDIEEALQASLPDDVELNLHYDRAELVMATLKTVAKNLIEGGLLVVAVLFLLLGSLRAGLVVAITIPISMLWAASGMVFLGIPGNLMSLGAIDFGLIVDGAVVIVERVFHALDPRHHPPGAFDHETVAGRRERVATAAAGVARPVLFAVLVILAVYMPILGLEGVDGKMFRPMAITMVLALLGSLLLAMTSVPALAAVALRPKDVPTRDPPLLRVLGAAHERALRLVLPRPMLVATSAVVVLVFGGVLAAGRGVSFIPLLDEGDLVLQTTRAPDISIDAAVDAGLRLETALRAIPEVLTITSRIGSPAVATDVMGLEQADVFVKLKPADGWRPGLTRDDLIAEIQRVAEGAHHAGEVEVGVTQPIQMRFNEMVGGEVTDVSVIVLGLDLGDLRRTAELLAQRIAGVPGAVDVRVTLPPEVPVLEVRPDPVRAAAVGLENRVILDATQSLQLGIDVGRTWRGPIEVPIVLRLGTTPPPVTGVGDVALPTTGGGLVPLRTVTDIQLADAPSAIAHSRGVRRISVGLNVRGADLGDVAIAVQQIVDETHLPDGIRVEVGGQVAQLARARARLAIIVPITLIVVLLLVVAALQKLRPALIVLLHVPFAIVGGLAALTIRDLPISMSAAVGFIALSGIAVQNGIVLVHEILGATSAGHDLQSASRLAASRRARPVMMTALVAMLGFVPMMLAHGVGAEVQRPLATVVVGGLVTSTVLTLLVLPTLYPWLAGGRRRSRQARARGPAPAEGGFDDAATPADVIDTDVGPGGLRS